MQRRALLTLMVVAVGLPWALSPAFPGGGPKQPSQEATLELAPAELLAILKSDVGRLAATTQAEKEFRSQSRVLQNDALALAVYAQIRMNESDKEMARRLATIRNGALGFAEAARQKNAGEAKKAIAPAEGSEPLSPASTQPRSAHITLTKLMPMTNLMEHLGLLNITISEYEQLTSADWGLDAKSTDAVRHTWKLTALVRVIEAYTPAEDPNPKKGQTRKLWAEATHDTGEAAGALHVAARARRGDDFKAGLQKLEAACNRCHQVYRVE